MEKQNSNLDPAAIFQHCKRYTDKKKTYNNGNRNNYIYALACNCNRRGLAEDQTLYFSMEEFDLPTEEIKATVASAYENKTEHNTAKTFGRKAEHNTPKSDEEKSDVPQIDKIENFLSERYELRYNIVTGKLEYKTQDEENFHPITDYRENSFLRELKKANLKCNSNTLRTILNSDFCQVYNPFDAYFNSLPAWDGTTDYITALARTVTTTQQELWEYCFRKWIVAMVGCAIDERTINHTVIVFSGKQGIGKTTWMLNLIPQQLKEYCYSGTINPNNKDTLINLSECIFINLDELENLNRSEIGTLKEIITKSQIRMRRAYGHNNESMIRRASLGGSVNTAQFLNDTTGSRRFLCFEVLEIAYRHKISMANVFAQALHLFNSGFKFWFDKDEIKTISANNEQYQMKTVEEEMLLTYFAKIDNIENATFLSTSEIAAKISVFCKMNVSNSTINLLGKALHKHGFMRRKRAGRYVYAVREISYSEAESISKQAEPSVEPETAPEDQELPF